MRTPPEAVTAYLQRNVPAAARAHARATISQTGSMRLRPGGAWLPFTAEQWFATESVEFCWHARVKMAPLVTAVVEDAYEGGRGRLDAKLWGKLKMAHGEGPEIDRGEVQRYLAELAWNPVALARNPALRFAAAADGALRVWAGERETYVDLHLDAAGDIASIFTETRAFGERGPTPWEGRFTDYAELGGVRLPRRGEVSWILPEGRFTYWRGEIVGLGWGDAAAP
ncbi:MAG: DUF6544 family protein [Nannocystaceae bacterium]